MKAYQTYYIAIGVFWILHSIFTLIAGIALVIHGEVLGVVLLLVSCATFLISRSIGYIVSISSDGILLRNIYGTTILKLDNIKSITFSSYSFCPEMTHMNIYTKSGLRYYGGMVKIEYAKKEIGNLDHVKRVASTFSEFKYIRL